MIKNFARLALLKGFVPAYEQVLRRKIDSELSLIPRHSALSTKDYSPLLSDLDLSAVGELTDEQTKILRKTHLRVQKLFPVIGELEIYSPEEWQERSDLFLALEPFYTPLRDLRKIRWMIRTINTSSSLAALRAKRGLAKSLLKLQIEAKSEELRAGRLKKIEPAIEKLAGEIISDFGLKIPDSSNAFSFYHPMLEIFLTNSPTNIGDPHVVCSESAAYLLAAISPMRTYQNIDEKKLAEFRSNPALASYLKDFARYELLTMSAGVRGLPKMPDWYLGNLPELKHWSAD